jgi:hypothetical protein
VRTSANNPIGKCRLCHTPNVELIDSHLVASAAYKLLDREGGCIAVNSVQGILKSKQWTDYLLCVACEERFNKGGEQWVMSNCYRGNKFRLREALEQGEPPFKREESFDVFRGSDIANINADQLAYFAASMFWRASCHDWGYERRSVLGKVYEEEFRRFLLGAGPWPLKAWLTIGCVPKRHDGFCKTFGLPKLDIETRGYGSHRLRFMGIMFLLSIGNSVPEEARTYCVQHTPNKFVVMGDAITAIVMGDLKGFENIEYKGKAKELVAPILGKRKGAIVEPTQR